MARGTSRCGFTLVELMFTTAIFAVVMIAVSSAFIGGMRLLKVTFATVEMSIQARMLRDRLLFHAVQPHGGAAWAGLLSYTNLVQKVPSGEDEDVDVLGPAENKIQMGGTGLKNDGSGELSAESEDFVLKRQGNGFVYDKVSLDNLWLRPSGLNFLAESSDSDVAPILVWAYEPNSDGTPGNKEDHTRFYINLYGRMQVAGGLPVEYRERIVVPVFGKTQITWPQNGGGLK